MKFRLKKSARLRRAGRWLWWLLLAWIALSLLLVMPLRWLAPPTSSFMLRHSGDVEQQWRDVDALSSSLALAVIAAEDQRFPQHYGVDWREIAAALRVYRRGGALRGASTLSQQLAKNLYLWPQRSLSRKLLEAWFTALIELCLPKRRILELYLNIAQFGPSLFGAEAAARRYFDRPAAQLTPAQAALLAALLPAPNARNADRPSPALRERQRFVLGQMDKLGLRYLDSVDWPRL